MLLYILLSFLVPIALSLIAGSIKESAVEAYPDGRSSPNITVSWTLSGGKSIWHGLYRS